MLKQKKIKLYKTGIVGGNNGIVLLLLLVAN